MSQTGITSLSGGLKRILPRFLWTWVRRVGTAILTPIRFSLRSGHFRSSLAARALDRHGEPLPWYTYPAIEAVRWRDFSGRSVLEFGGGQSSLWWAERADQVVTIEPDGAWAAELKGKCAGLDHIQIFHVPVDRETRDISGVIAAIQQSGITSFDVVIVDGHLRHEVARHALDLMTPDGVMIFDNPVAHDFDKITAEVGMSRVDFYGHTPGVHAQDCTSFGFRGECFLFSPDAPILRIEHKL